MTYEPDEQDELVGDAMAVGGPAFVEELHYAAMDAAEAACPWDGNGDEPPEYRRAWIAAARQLVTQRRADIATTAVASERRSSSRARSRGADDTAGGPVVPER